MVCSLALDPRFKHFAVQLCGLSRGEDYVWGVVKDAALHHKKFEKGSSEEVAEFQHQSGHELASSMLFMRLLKKGRRKAAVVSFLTLPMPWMLQSMHTERCLCFHKKLIHLASGETIQLHLFFSRFCRWQPQSQQYPQLRLFVSDFSRREGKC